MRIPSGKIDQRIYFVAIDPVDLRTRVIGLSFFTVAWSRNGSPWAIYTAPTIIEIGDGVYALLVNEDTDIAVTSDSEEYCVHITENSSPVAMEPVTRTVELYRAAPTVDENADALLDRTAGVETNRTLRQALRIMLAAVAGKASGLATATATYRDTNDSKNRIVATVDADGNRSAVTLDAS